MINFQDVTFELSCGNSKQLPKSDLLEIVFSGRSNVGKSSLINKLVNRKALARVSSSPGKTATINFYNLKNIRLVDLPGYGYAKVSFDERKRWADLVEEYFNSNRNLALVVQIIDMRHKPTNDDMNMLNYLNDSKLPFIVVFTKSDKLNKTQRIQREIDLNNDLNGIKSLKNVPFSSINTEGLEEIKSLIFESVKNNNIYLE